METLLKTLPAVKDAAVVGLPHVTDGELVTAAVLYNPGFEFTSESLVEETVNGRFYHST